MDTTTPVVPSLEAYQVNVGGNQPEYQGIPALVSPEGRVVSRWTFTEQERRAIAEGADLYLTTMTFNQAFQPVRLEVGSPMPGLSPEGIKRDMRLDDQAEMMVLLAEYNRCAEAANTAQAALKQKQQEVFTPPEKKIALVH